MMICRSVVLFIVGMISATEVTEAQEIPWQEPSEVFRSSPGSSEIFQSSSCTSCETEACSQGTLFSWPGFPEATGGPDLEEPLVTDRPDFTEASVTVGRNVLQVEMGYTYIFNNDGGIQDRGQTFGEILFRYGIWEDWLEFRLAVTPEEARTRAAGISNSTAGMSDLYLGAKIALTPQAGWLPEMAILPQANVPTGSPNLSSDHFEPGVNWVYSWEVNDDLALAGSTQVNRAIDDNGASYAEFAQSASLGLGLTEQLGMYTEWFAFFPSGASTPPGEHYFNGGFTYLITDDIQWDIRGGLGLNSAAQDYFVGTGLSIRFR